MLFFNWAVGRGLQLEVTWITSSFYFFCLFWHRVLLCGGQVLPHLVCSLGWPQIWAPHASSLGLPSLKLKVFDTMSGLMLNLNLNRQGSLLGLLNLAMEHIASEEPEFSSYVSFGMFLDCAVGTRSIHWTFSNVIDSWRQRQVDLSIQTSQGLQWSFTLWKWWNHSVVCDTYHDALSTSWVSVPLSWLLVKGGPF